MYWILKLNVDVQPLKPDPLAESFFSVNRDGTRLFVIGFDRTSYLSDHVYIVMAPSPEITKISIADLKYLKTEFAKLTGYLFYCQLNRHDPKAIRWAKFFGFEFHLEISLDYVQYIKDAR
jgi:hypothetical protein